MQSRDRFVVSLLSLAIFGFGMRPKPANALSCASPPWAGGAGSPVLFGRVSVPENAVLWLGIDCVSLPDPLPDECVLVNGDQKIPLEISLAGASACEIAEVSDDRLRDAPPEVLARFTPMQPLVSGQSYVFECGDFWIAYQSGGTVQVREGGGPAAPPLPLGELSVRSETSGASGCGGGCGVPDHLELSIDLEAPYLEEGGYVEAVYPSGQVVVITGPGFNDQASLPLGPSPIELTPVAADGTRGETVVINDSDIETDSGESGGCQLGSNGFAPLFWLLAPFGWLRFRRRRCEA